MNELLRFGKIPKPEKLTGINELLRFGDFAKPENRNLAKLI
jgi:hypothetical protein